VTDGVLLEVAIPREISYCCWPNSRCHWRAKAEDTQAMRTVARYCAADVLAMTPVTVPPAGPLSVQWTIVLGKGKRQRDIDNTIAACKPLMDGIFDVLEADDKRVTQVGVRWERGTESGIKCRIASLDTRG